MSPTEQPIERLLEEHGDLAARVARGMARRLPRCVDRDEVQAAALVGLWRAARRYDPARGSFRRYALPFVRGEVLDWLRKADHLTRTQRHRDRGHRLASLGRLLPGDRGRARALGEVLVEPRSERQARQAALCEEVDLRLRRLPSRLALVLRLYFLEGMLQKQIARRLGLSDAHVSCLITEALEEARLCAGRTP